MPAATTKQALLAATDTEWAKLDALLAKVSTPLMRDGDDPSIRDIITHRTHWTRLFFQWLDEGAAAQMPDHGVKWNQLKAYNAGLRQRYADIGWQDARDALAHEHARLRAWISDADEAVLYGGPMPGGTGWTSGRYAEAAGPSHYRSAAKYIRGVLKRAG